MKIIVWDVDDVLNSLMQTWFETKWLVDHPTCTLKYADIIENPPHKLLNVSLDEYTRSLDAFRLSPQYMELAPNKEVLAWFNRYGTSARHMVLTAVPLEMAHFSASWVIKHFGKWIRSFNFVPTKRNNQTIPEYDNNKQTFLKWFAKVDLFIEDNENNIAGLREKSLLVARPWNKSKTSLPEALNKITKLMK